MSQQTVILRLVFAAGCLLACVPGYAQYASQQGIEVASIDANTRWGLRSLGSVSIASPIVRLGDVAVPLDPNMAGWQRISRITIGLVPLDGHPMKIDRRRLTELIRGTEATPHRIDWVGPEKIVVGYQPNPNKRSSQLAAARYQSIQDQVVVGADLQYGQVTAKPVSRLSDSEKKKVMQWIQRGVTSFRPEVLTDYAIDVDASQPDLAKLRSLAAITNLEILDSVREGAVRCRMSARGVSGTITADFELLLQLHPQVVVPRSGLSRGDQINATDLEFQSISSELMKPEYITDMAEVIGMEARSPLSANRPIRRDRLGAPILIRRGELIEVQVVGGGITVSTKGKANGDGAASDLIEIETFQPRKRLLGRVVQAGLVEIITRAPGVRR
ncbi:MAG: flagellar basal body P-ring formation chaperone FlgA [Rubripirellula sp.]|nr:flagellar basal body P-ring formation chaperone FlgA [Rubripirellula sp.]